MPQSEKVSRTLDADPKASKPLSLEEFFQQDKKIFPTDIPARPAIQRTLYINGETPVSLGFIMGGLADKIRQRMPEVPPEKIPGIIETLAALAESDTNICMYTYLPTLIGDILAGHSAEDIIGDQIAIDQATAETEAYRQKAHEEKKARKKMPPTKMSKADEEDEEQELVNKEESVETWKSSDTFKGRKGSNTYEGNEIPGYSKQSIRGIHIKCVGERGIRTYEMAVPVSTKLHEGKPRDNFYLAFLRACIENWDKKVDESFEDKEGRVITRKS